MAKQKEKKIIKIDPYLKPFEDDINLRDRLYQEKRNELLKDSKTLSAFANG